MQRRTIELFKIIFIFQLEECCRYSFMGIRKIHRERPMASGRDESKTTRSDVMHVAAPQFIDFVHAGASLLAQDFPERTSHRNSLGCDIAGASRCRRRCGRTPGLRAAVAGSHRAAAELCGCPDADGSVAGRANHDSCKPARLARSRDHCAPPVGPPRAVDMCLSRGDGGGALFSYGVNLVDVFRDVAAAVDQVARLGNAGEIPMRSPSHFHTAVNVKTAKALGLQIPDRLLALADEVIE